MAPMKFMFLAAAILMLVSSCDSVETTGKNWNDSSICPYPCYPYAPPSQPDYPPPTPPTPPSQPDYPPPTPPTSPSPPTPSNCPPAGGGVQCCQSPPQTPSTPSNTLPYYRSSASLSSSPLPGFPSSCFMLSFFYAVLF